MSYVKIHYNIFVELKHIYMILQNSLSVSVDTFIQIWINIYLLVAHGSSGDIRSQSDTILTCSRLLNPILFPGFNSSFGSSSE